MSERIPDKRSRLPDQQVVELCDLLRDLVDRNMAWTVTFRAHVIKGITKMSDQAKKAPVSAIAPLHEAAQLLLQAEDMERHNESIFNGKWKKGSKAWGGEFIERTWREGMDKLRAAIGWQCSLHGRECVSPHECGAPTDGEVAK